jgi:ubiquinone/menaquinone biosynthesis C-methylase UbiE
MSPLEPDEQRSATREAWERAAEGWGKRADRIRDWGMPVSAAMVEALALQPGQRVLELAAGPGDTGFMAAEMVAPGGTLISSDGADAMLEVARARAAELGIDNVTFSQLELEWIDLETASVDAVLVRWGIMLIVDPEAAAREVRRVLRPGGRAAFAVWDLAERNPWATIPGRAMVELGHAEAPDPAAPGMFSLAENGRLTALLEGTGFEDIVVSPVAVARHYDRLESYVEETIDMSPMFSAAYRELGADDQVRAVAAITALAQPYVADDGSVTLPGSSLVASAGA